jgi:curved DNA-binding protein
VLALDPDVARQTPQPFRGKSAPKHEAEENGNCTENNQKSSGLTHRRIFSDKSRGGKPETVERDCVEPKKSNSKFHGSAERRLTNLVGAPSHARVAQRGACEEIRTMAVQFRDYYETLGVPKTASDNEIRAAFRKLARKHHPDVAKDKKTAEEKFKQINEAYEVLGDPEKRKKYDQLGADWNQPGGLQPPPGWGAQQPEGGFYRHGDDGGIQFEFGGTGFSDFFEAFFGGGRGRSAFGGFGGRQATAERGSDVEADIMVTLEEALHGSTRTVSLRRAGSNKVESYQVKIPRGVHEGQRIRLAGQGEAGAGGGKSGDLFLRVRLARHPDFSVEGSDLIHELKIAPWQAALGAEIEVPTLEGSVRLKVPAGTQGGQRFRLRGRGLPGISGKRGDLYVDVQINVPKKLTEREREIWSELAKLHGG